MSTILHPVLILLGAVLSAHSGRFTWCLAGLSLQKYKVQDFFCVCVSGKRQKAPGFPAQKSECCTDSHCHKEKGREQRMGFN